MTQQPHTGGFWSYVNHDDVHENGRITRLLERLERSIRFFSGNRAFRIFQDRKDIGWGEKWAERLAGSVNDALLLFPVVTPSYFASAACREEVLAFQERQKSFARDDLILPIYYLTTAYFEDAQHGTSEEAKVATLLRAYQYEDWRALRDTPESDPAYAKSVERLAQRAVEALNRVPPQRVAETRPKPSPKSASSGQAHESGGDSAASAERVQDTEKVGGPEGKSEPGLIVTLTVNPMPGRAQFTTISEAITRAPAGARILVVPGHYRESLVIDKPLELIGDGSREDIIVETEGAPVLVFDTNIGVVRNLTFRQSEKTSRYYCILIKQGRLELDDCDLSSRSLACLAVTNNADPRVRRNRIHHGAQSGILIYDNATGTYEENEIFQNTLAGIEVSSGTEPVVRRNRIFDGGGSGIYLHDEARGTIEDNDIFGNTRAGVSVMSGADPIVRRNRVYDGRQGGILVWEKGRGTFEDNEIFGNAYAGVEVRTEAEPVVRRNRIHDGKQSGIYVYDRGRGTFEDNQIDSNQSWGINIDNGGDPIVRRNAISGNVRSGVRVGKGGGGTFANNELSGNREAWHIDPSVEGQVKRSGNREN